MDAEPKTAGLYLDLTKVSYEGLRDVMGEILDDFEAAGLDVRKEPIEIAPAAHSCMGGVIIDTNGRTDVDGLFVAGENGGGPSRGESPGERGSHRVRRHGRPGGPGGRSCGRRGRAARKE